MLAGQVLHGHAARVLEQGGVAPGEGRPFGLGAGVEARAEQEAEGVREVVEGRLGGVEVQLRGPEVRVVPAEAVVIGLALGVLHQTVELGHADGAFAAGGVEGRLEQEAGVDVHAEGDAVQHLLLEEGEPARGVRCVADGGVGDDPLGEGGGRLGQAHGVVPGQQGQFIHQPLVVGVAQLVGQRPHVGGGAPEGHEDPRLAAQGEAGAEAAGPLVGAVFGFDPALAEGLPGQGGQVVAEAGELFDDELGRLVIGHLALGVEDGHVGVVPGEPLDAQAFGLPAEVLQQGAAPPADRVPHGLQGGPLHAVLVQRLLEDVLPPAPAVPLPPEAGQVIEGGGDDLRLRAPGCLPAVEHGGAHGAIRVFQPVGRLAHGELDPAVAFLDGHPDAPRDQLVQVAPGVVAVDGQHAGQGLQGGIHALPGPPAAFVQGKGDLLQTGLLQQRRPVRIADGQKVPVQAGPQVAVGGAQLADAGEEEPGPLVGGVLGDQAEGEGAGLAEAGTGILQGGDQLRPGLRPGRGVQLLHLLLELGQVLGQAGQEGLELG